MAINPKPLKIGVSSSPIVDCVSMRVMAKICMAEAAAIAKEEEIKAAEARAEEEAKEKARKLRAQRTQTVLTPLGTSDQTKLGL